MADIIENVRRNEALYDNLDAILDTHYTIGDREPARMADGANKGDSETLDTNLRTHYVAQDSLFRLDIEGATRSANHDYSRDRIRAFDGTTTRLYDQKAIGNIIPGRSDDPNFIRPHMMLLRFMQYGFPLSTYLSGDEALLAHPSASAWWASTNCTLETTYQGKDYYNGLACHRVWITTFAKDFGAYSRWELWLAEDRNYLPVKNVSYGFKFSKNVPDGEAVVTELREIAPGIWFPFAAEDTAYNQMILQREGKQVFQWRESYVVESASLDPAYEVSFFRDIVFPPGTAVYEIANDKIQRSYRADDPSTDAASGVLDYLAGFWLLWLNIIVAFVAILYYVRRSGRGASRLRQLSRRSIGGREKEASHRPSESSAKM